MASIARSLLLLLVLTALAKGLVFYVALPFGSDLPETYPDLEPYEDYKVLYSKETQRFLAGERLYRDFYHAYPPLFIYSQAAVTMLLNPHWAGGLGIVLFDIAAIAPAYLLTRHLTTPRIAFYLSLLSALAPLHLFYNDVLWLNPPPMNFFFVLALYVLVRRYYELGAFLLALATGFKQIAVAVLPVVILLTFRMAGWRKAGTSFLIYAVVLLVMSLPYLTDVPQHYLWALGVPGVPAPTGFSLDLSPGWQWTLSDPMNLARSLGLFGLGAYYEPGLSVLTGVLLLSIGVILYRAFRERELTPRAVTAYVLMSFLAFHAFFPRGIYKYYFASLLPLLAPLLLWNRRDVGFFLVMNLALLGVPRFMTPWLALLLLLVVPSLLEPMRSRATAEPLIVTAG